jgi:hypothetical protein
LVDFPNDRQALTTMGKSPPRGGNDQYLFPRQQRLLALGRKMAASLGLDSGSVVFDALDGYLNRAGLYNVVRRQFSIPIGEWGGRVGSLMATDGRAAFTRLCEVLEARSGLPAQEGRELIGEAVREWERGRMSAPCAVAFGRKPDARRS